MTSDELADISTEDEAEMRERNSSMNYMTSSDSRSGIPPTEIAHYYNKCVCNGVQVHTTTIHVYVCNGVTIQTTIIHVYVMGHNYTPL